LDDSEIKIHPEEPMLSLVIQAGGESRRMGRDKALLPFLGQPLILRPLNRLARLADEVLVTSNRPENYRSLGLRPIHDRMPGCGALGGLYTALDAASHPYVAVVACDMPFASLELFAYELVMIRMSGAHAVIPRSGAGTEPFHAIYRREACLLPVRAALEAGKRRVDAWFGQVHVRYLELQEIQPYDPDGLAFLNINTMEELKAAETTAQNLTTQDRPG
jgi:molybdopterin-guanine dinucleotide biosynthesis protein A